MLKLILFLFLLFSSNSYHFAPLTKYVFNLNKGNEDIHVVEGWNINKKKTTCIIFSTGGSSFIPPQIYCHLLDNLASNGFSIYTPSFKYKNKDLLIDKLDKEYSEVILMGHSSGGTTAINFAKNKKIKKLILLDPVDTRFVNKEYRNKIHELEHLNSILFLNAAKSYNITFDPLGFPFIPILRIKPEIMKLKEKCKIVDIEAIKFGHCDILDLHYSNLMHKSRIAVGNNKRTFNQMNIYHDWITYMICKYTGKKTDIEFPLSVLFTLNQTNWPRFLR